MNNNGLEYISAYIHDLSFISNGNFENHLNKVKRVLLKLKAGGFKINAEKSFFTKDNLEYLDFTINRQDIMPLPDNIQAIKYISHQRGLRPNRFFQLDLACSLRPRWLSILQFFCQGIPTHECWNQELYLNSKSQLILLYDLNSFS